MNRILVTGGTGMVGTAFKRIEDKNIFLTSSSEYNLLDMDDAMKMLDDYHPTHIIHLAARVGGVKGNTDFVGDYYLENILINTHVLEAARRHRVKKLVSLLSTCVYPEEVRYPLTENQIHNGEPHPSNFGYAYAKRMLDVQSRAYRQQYDCNFITAVPNNLFGENDNFHLIDGHVIPAIIRKVFEAYSEDKPSVSLWGDGSPLREFTYSRDITKILLFLLETYDDPGPINIGSTGEVSIMEVANAIVKIIGYKGEIVWDDSMPSGQNRKPSCNKKLVSLGWSEYTNFYEGLSKTCAWFKENYPNIRGLN
jgi:GDP-L-fucose synthase